MLGCTSQPDTESQGIQDDSNSKLSGLVTVGHLESSMEPAERPKSAAELTSRFIETYQLDPKTAFVNFFDWHDLSQQSRREIVNGLLTLAYSAKRQDACPITNTALSIIDIKRHSAELNITVEGFNKSMPVSISHVFEFESQRPNGIVIHTVFGIGQRDGTFYFYPDYYPNN